MMDLDGRQICHCARHSIGPHWHNLPDGCPREPAPNPRDVATRDSLISITLTRAQWREVKAVVIGELDHANVGPLLDALDAHDLGENPAAAGAA